MPRKNTHVDRVRARSDIKATFLKSQRLEQPNTAKHKPKELQKHSVKISKVEAASLPAPEKNDTKFGITYLDTDTT